MSILGLIADARTDREIADESFLAEKAVKDYVSDLLTKMGVAPLRRRPPGPPTHSPGEWEANA